jgi:hypothetical protein
VVPVTPICDIKGSNTRQKKTLDAGENVIPCGELKVSPRTGVGVRYDIGVVARRLHLTGATVFSG